MTPEKATTKATAKAKRHQPTEAQIAEAVAEEAATRIDQIRPGLTHEPQPQLTDVTNGL